jgi:hypothetical protein
VGNQISLPGAPQIVCSALSDCAMDFQSRHNPLQKPPFLESSCDTKGGGERGGGDGPWTWREA